VIFDYLPSPLIIGTVGAVGYGTVGAVVNDHDC